MNQQQLGQELFARIKKDLSENGYDFPIGRPKKGSKTPVFPTDYFISRRTLFYVKKGIITPFLLKQLETRLKIKVSFDYTITDE